MNKKKNVEFCVNQGVEQQTGKVITGRDDDNSFFVFVLPSPHPTESALHGTCIDVCFCLDFGIWKWRGRVNKEKNASICIPFRNRR
jgi:hypothetical protein